MPVLYPIIREIPSNPLKKISRQTPKIKGKKVIVLAK
jgi:hypothetical protein